MSGDDARAERPGTWIVPVGAAGADTRLRAMLAAEGVQDVAAAPQDALEVPDTGAIGVGERLGAWCLDLKRTRFDLTMPRDPVAGDTVRGFGDVALADDKPILRTVIENLVADCAGAG